MIKWMTKKKTHSIKAKRNSLVVFLIWSLRLMPKYIAMSLVITGVATRDVCTGWALLTGETIILNEWPTAEYRP